jgi:hypothetical protein
MEIYTVKKPLVQMPQKVWDKMLYWARKAAPKEIAGYGVIAETFGKGDMIKSILVKDIILSGQDVSSGHAELSVEGMAEAMKRTDAMGIPPEDVRSHWHSHHTMGKFWSPVDDNLMEQFADGCNVLCLVTIIDGSLPRACYVVGKAPSADVVWLPEGQGRRIYIWQGGKLTKLKYDKDSWIFQEGLVKFDELPIELIAEEADKTTWDQEFEGKIAAPTSSDRRSGWARDTDEASADGEE